MASKVYFADFRCPTWRENLPQKLARLMMTAGFGDIDMDGKYVAIKMHFGEPGNLAFLRPNWAKTVADFVKERGGKPFLTDCNTLYVGSRKDADFATFPATSVSLPSYTTVDASVQYQLRPDLAVQLRVANLGDKRYETAYGFNQLGRAAYLTLKWAMR